MSVARLVYVICDRCGVPASQPVDPGHARRNVPYGWERVIRTAMGKRIDLCPKCQR